MSVNSKTLAGRRRGKSASGVAFVARCPGMTAWGLVVVSDRLPQTSGPLPLSTCRRSYSRREAATTRARHSKIRLCQPVTDGPNMTTGRGVFEKWFTNLAFWVFCRHLNGPRTGPRTAFKDSPQTRNRREDQSVVEHPVEDTVHVLQTLDLVLVHGGTQHQSRNSETRGRLLTSSTGEKYTLLSTA